MEAGREEALGLIAELRSAVERGDQTESLLESHSVSAQAHALTELFNAEEYELMPLAVPTNLVHDMRPTGIPGLGVYRGRDEYRRFIEEWVDAFPGAQIEIQLSFEIPGRRAFFGVGHQEVRGGSSELPVSFQYAIIAEQTPGTSSSTFGLDLAAMRDEFVRKYGMDPGPIPARRESRQEV